MEKIWQEYRYPVAQSDQSQAKREAGTDMVVAHWTGEPRRLIRKGEWYLSGAIIEAYRAPSDLSMKFHPAKLLRGVTTVRWEPVTAQ
jgi:hypothetical protein